MLNIHLSNSKHIFIENGLIPKFTPVKSDYIIDFSVHDNTYHRILISLKEGLAVMFPLDVHSQLPDYNNMYSESINYLQCKDDDGILMFHDVQYGWVPATKNIQDIYNNEVANKILTLGIKE